MEKLKQWVALTVVAVLAVAAAGWFLLISPKRADAASLKAQTQSQESSNKTLSTRIQMLKAQAKQLPQQQAKLAAVAAKVPDNPALPTLIRALTDAAQEAGVELISLSPGLPTDVKAAVAPVAVKPKAAGATAVKNPAAARAAASAAAAASSSAGTLQSISLTLNVVGGYFQVEQFLDGVENLTRAMKVDGFTLAPGENPLKASTAGTPAVDTGLLNVSITGSVYMATGRGLQTATSAATTVGK